MSRLASRSTLFAALAVVGLVGSYVLVYSLGTGQVGAGEEPLGSVETADSWCEPAAIAVDALGAIEPGPDSLDRGIAALVELRSADPEMTTELDVLVDAYQALADGDLTDLGEPETVAAIDAAAAGLSGALADRCGLGLSAPDDS